MFKAYDLEKLLEITIRHIYKHLNRFIEKGYIEKHPKTRGLYRFTDLGIKKIKGNKLNSEELNNIINDATIGLLSRIDPKY